MKQENTLLSKEEFIKRSQLAHGERYNYNNSLYLGNKKKLEIICNIHGSFLQIPNAHFRGVGCPECAKENKINYNLKEVTKNENKNKPCSLYVLKLINERETFLKVGVTKNNVISRYYGFKKYFEYEILLELPLNIKESFEIEQSILHNLRKYKYITNNKFPGYRECLKIDAKDLILNEIKQSIINKYNKNTLVGKILDYEYGK